MTQVLELPVRSITPANVRPVEQSSGIALDRLSALAYHRVVLVSSHPLYLIGLRGEVSQWAEFKVIGEAEDTAGVLNLVGSGPVSLIIIDQARPDEALPLLQALQQRLQGRIPLVVLGSIETETQVTQLRQLGATAFASKTLEGSALREVLQKATQDRRPLPGIRHADPTNWPTRPVYPAQPVAAVRRGKTGELKSKAPLSPREIEILEVIAQGHSNKEVANQLCISNHTLKNHLNNIFKKLNVEDRTQALMLSVRSGWIRL